MKHWKEWRVLLLLGWWMHLGPLLYAQQPATQEALNRACACLERDSLPAPQALSPLLDSCIGEGLYQNLTGVLREHGADLNSDSSLFRLAQTIHQALSRDCPHFRKVTQGIAIQQLEVVKVENQQSRGLLYELNTAQQFPELVLITSDNEPLRFLWLREFDGSTRFMNGIKDYQNSRILVVWKPVELYDVVTQTYREHREILLVEEEGSLSNKERRAWLKRYKKAVKRKDK